MPPFFFIFANKSSPRRRTVHTHMATTAPRHGTKHHQQQQPQLPRVKLRSVPKGAVLPDMEHAVHVSRFTAYVQEHTLPTMAPVSAGSAQLHRQSLLVRRVWEQLRFITTVQSSSYTFPVSGSAPFHFLALPRVVLYDICRHLCQSSNGDFLRLVRWCRLHPTCRDIALDVWDALSVTWYDARSQKSLWMPSGGGGSGASSSSAPTLPFFTGMQRFMASLLPHITRVTYRGPIMTPAPQFGPWFRSFRALRSITFVFVDGTPSSASSTTAMIHNAAPPRAIVQEFSAHVHSSTAEALQEILFDFASVKDDTWRSVVLLLQNMPPHAPPQSSAIRPPSSSSSAKTIPVPPPEPGEEDDDDDDHDDGDHVETAHQPPGLTKETKRTIQDEPVIGDQMLRILRDCVRKCHNLTHLTLVCPQDAAPQSHPTLAGMTDFLRHLHHLQHLDLRGWVAATQQPSLGNDDDEGEEDANTHREWMLPFHLRTATGWRALTLSHGGDYHFLTMCSALQRLRILPREQCQSTVVATTVKSRAHATTSTSSSTTSSAFGADATDAPDVGVFLSVRETLQHYEGPFLGDINALNDKETFPAYQSLSENDYRQALESRGAVVVGDEKEEDGDDDEDGIRVMLL